jgi:DNA-binding SARP family transcriptional activator
MALFQLRLFGKFELAGGPLGARRARELLCYLLLNGSRPQRRDSLAGLLWEEAAPAQAGKYLRQALWQLQAALRPLAAAGAAPALEVDPEWIGLTPCPALEVDLRAFEQAARACHGVPGALLDDAARCGLEAAVALYRGELLEGWYQDWCLAARERLQNDFLEMLEKLVCSCEARGDGERGLAYARRMLALDPAREQVHRHVMRLQLMSGNRTGALRAFELCERTLMAELGVAPAPETRALYEAARSGHSDPPHAASPPEQLLPLAELLRHAQQLLACVESRLRQELPAPPPPSDGRN